MAVMHMFIYLLSSAGCLFTAGIVYYVWYVYRMRHAYEYIIKTQTKVIWLYFDPLKLFQLQCFLSLCPQPSVFCFVFCSFVCLVELSQTEIINILKFDFGLDRVSKL